MAKPAKSQNKTKPRSLTDYHAKRDFERTPEPSGKEKKRTPAISPGLQYVIQKHAARRLHYDFRLELDGVLLSWPIPKGPSLNPADKRLAVRTEDHPLDYADFEGIIPKGEYGGGTVIVWDQGTWQPKDDPHEGLKKGRLSFVLDGKKLHGLWHLVKTRLQGGKENWLFFKGTDGFADKSTDIVAEQPQSVISGLTIEEVAASPTRVWHSNRPDDEPDKVADKFRRNVAAKLFAKTAPEPPKTRAASSAKKAKPRASTGNKLNELVLALPVDFTFTNLDKILYPEQGVSKAMLIAYYATISNWLLPHIKSRPLTLVRCPDGHHKQCFYQKHAGEGVPKSVKRIKIREESGSGVYMWIDGVPGLLAMPQLGALELHTWACHADGVEKPDQLTFDLDPDVGLGWDAVVEAALEMREHLEELGLETFVKTTGGKGLHVVAPLEPKLSWDDHKGFANAVANEVAAAKPKQYTTNPLKAQRKGKIFLDYLRNARGATAVAPYSTRARAHAPVATPLTWKELESGVTPLDFTVATLPNRVTELRADPWRDYFKVKQSISPSVLRKHRKSA